MDRHYVFSERRAYLSFQEVTKDTTDFINFIKKTKVKNRTFPVSWTSQVFFKLYRITRALTNRIMRFSITNSELKHLPLRCCSSPVKMKNENINLRVKNVEQKLATSRYTNAHKIHNLLQRSAEEHALEMSPLEFLFQNKPDLAGQISPVIKRIPLLIRTLQSDQSYTKQYMLDGDREKPYKPDVLSSDFDHKRPNSFIPYHF